METLLKGQDSDAHQRPSPPQAQENGFTAPANDENILNLPEVPALSGDMGGSIPPITSAVGASQPSQSFYPPVNSIPRDPQWDLISLGLEEPLPAQDVIDEL